jgi:hypothetical protein
MSSPIPELEDQIDWLEKEFTEVTRKLEGELTYVISKYTRRIRELYKELDKIGEENEDVNVLEIRKKLDWHIEFVIARAIVELEESGYYFWPASSVTVEELVRELRSILQPWRAVREE